jgi:2-aminoadipate transaminase
MPELADLFAARARNVPPPIFSPDAPGTVPTISLAWGLADPALFPRAALLSATAEVLEKDAPAALNYGATYSGLIEQIVARLRASGVAAQPEQVLVGHGSSQILALLPEVLVDRGDVVLIEGPSFMGAVRRFAQAGAQLVTVPTDAHGLDTDALATILRDLRRHNKRPKFLYTIPTFHNPTGATLSLERRHALVALAAEYGVLVVEDDAYYDLRFEGEPLPPLAALDRDGWVMRVGTFSKTLAPGLRMGWACARPEIIQRLQMFKWEGSSGPFMTRLVARFCADGQLDAHIAALNTHYRHKRDVMLDAIAQHCPADVQVDRPAGGFFVWLRLPPDLHAAAVQQAASEQGVAFVPGTACYADGQGTDTLRLAFSFQPVEQIEAGVARLGAAMHALRQHRAAR